MEKEPRRSSSDSIEENFFLPSTFSPWSTREQFVGDNEPTLSRSGAQTAVPSPAISKEGTSSYVPETHVTRPPLTRHASSFKPIMTAETPMTEEDLVLRPADHGMHPRTEVVITGGDKKRAPPRTTRFKEMLTRSLSSTLLSKKGPSSPHTKYDTVAEEPPASSMQRDSEIYPMDTVDTPTPGLKTRCSSLDEEDDDIGIDELAARYGKFSSFVYYLLSSALTGFLERPPLDCHSRRDVYIKRRSWTYIVLAVLSVYSTFLSGLWFVTSIYQPRYGRGISSSDGWKMAPSTATLVCTLFAKTIELSFVTVFVALLGQVLTRRAFVRKAKGVTLAEMTMRNWVIVCVPPSPWIWFSYRSTNDAYSNPVRCLRTGRVFPTLLPPFWVV